ncbi:MmyB family transcriptional regulator [Streptomyces olivaceoviridis]|uniref:MmyB family transcriptional regulator n=1 Tax=Streptomyces olivaceoviridis TaxID=1921 RepID=UPI0036CEB505
MGGRHPARRRPDADAQREQPRGRRAGRPGGRTLPELSLRDEQFRQWWAAHDVAVRDTGARHPRPPVVGDRHLDWNADTWAADPDLQIIVWTAEPGTPSRDSLRLPASWAADPGHSISGSSV